MKKIKFLLIVLLLPLSLSAQIKLAEDKPKEKEPEWLKYKDIIYAPYDSSYLTIKLFPVLDAYEKYIGQQLYLPVEERSMILFSDKLSRSGANGRDGYVWQPSKKCICDNITSSYDIICSDPQSVRNKYYSIIGVLSTKSEQYIKHHSKSTVCSHRFGQTGKINDYDVIMKKANYPYFILQEKESGDTVYTVKWQDFLLVGGFTKIQQEFVGLNIFKVKDVPSSDFIFYKQNYDNLIVGRWKCVDVVLLRSRIVGLVLQNTDNAAEKTEIRYDGVKRNEFWGEGRERWVIESVYNETWDKVLAENAVKEKMKKEKELQLEKENQQYRQQRLQQEVKRKKELTAKYGAVNADKIIAGKFEIGMSKAVCKEIAGYANVADKTATTETWKVSDIFFGGTTYLFFEGDKLVRIVNR